MLGIANLEAQHDTDSSSDREDVIEVTTNVEGKYAIVSLLKLQFLDQGNTSIKYFV